MRSLLPVQAVDSFGTFGDLFGRRLMQQADPFAAAASGDPFGSSGGSGGSADPFAGSSGSGGADPFASSGGSGSGDAFDPFGSSSSSGSSPDAATAGASNVPWDLGGGWMSGMAGGEHAAVDRHN